MPATIRDVAKWAGVSVATVSRALNQSGPVGAETQRRIRAAASALDYAPNSAARSLITRRTATWGVLLPDLFGEFFSELIRGIDEAAQAHSRHLLLSSSHDHADELKVALQGMHGRVDGLIVMAPTLDARVLQSLLPSRVPIVLINSAQTTAGHGLGIDNRGGARAIVSHLIEHGHRDVAIIKGPAGNHDARERALGYRAALRAAGISLRPELEMSGDFRSSAGYEAVENLLRLSAPPSAIFASNDAMAMGALSALRDQGVEVPEEMALAGFDDLSSTAYSIPPLTSVHVAISELGGRAIMRLAEATGNGAQGQRRRETLPARAVLRQSCGCPGRVGERAVEVKRSSNGKSHQSTQIRRKQS